MGGGKSSTPATPTPTPSPPPPDRTSTQVQNAADQQRQRYYGAQGGRSDTMLTSGSGADQPVSSTVRLLGNVGK